MENDLVVGRMVDVDDGTDSASLGLASLDWLINMKADGAVDFVSKIQPRGRR